MFCPLQRNLSTRTAMDATEDPKEYIQPKPKDNSPEDVQRFKDNATKYHNRKCDFCDERKPITYGMHHEHYGDVMGICPDCIPVVLILSGYESD
jgi:hypothetical protein